MSSTNPQSSKNKPHFIPSTYLLNNLYFLLFLISPSTCSLPSKKIPHLKYNNSIFSMANKSFQGLFSPLEVVSTNKLLTIEQDQCKITMSRIYYSSIFKIYYISLIILCSACIFLTLLDFYEDSKILFLLEVVVCILLVFECIFRGFMQGWELFIKKLANAVDLIVTLVSIILLWLSYNIGGGIGEIDEIIAITVVVVRCGIQFLRLVRAVKRRREQDIQIIDLNGISESDEAPQHTEKNLKVPKSEEKIDIDESKKGYEESVDESQ